MKIQLIRSIFILFGTLAIFAISNYALGACGIDYQKNDSVPDLERQFLSLQRHGDAMAFRRGAGDHPKLCKHYQGITRSKGLGTPYLYLARSGIHTIGCTVDQDNPGELLIVEMGSRNTLGERFGSNRLKKGISLEDYAPPKSDRGVFSYHFGIYEDKKGKVWPRYTHPGSIQLIDDVLVVALENYCKTDFIVDPMNEGNSICPPIFIPPSWPWETWKNGNIEPRSAIAFINVADPSDPYLIAVKEFPDLDEGLGVVGAARIFADGNIPGLYLFILTWGDSSKLKIAYAVTDDLNDIKAADIIPFGGFWVEDYLGDDKGKWRNWQTLQFLRNYNENNPNDLYLIGSEKAAGSTSKDWISLFKFNLDKLIPDTPDPVNLIEFKYERHFHLGEPDMGSFDAASTLHVTPTGQLVFYSTSHDSKTDTKDELGYEVESIPMGEFRNIFVSQDFTCGPQWRYGDPDKHLCVPDQINEGESVEIDGTVYFIEPWVHLFEDKLEPFNYSGLGLMMDASSVTLDNFDDLDNFKFAGNDFKDDADAFTFCGVLGSTLILNTEPFFGGVYLSMEGNGTVAYVPDLGDYGPYHLNFHDNIESATILWDSQIGPEYLWTLGENAHGEIIGNGPSATYTAGCGTYEETIYMGYEFNDIWQAQSIINVINLPPSIEELSLSNETAHIGEPVTISGLWSDACADYADVNVNWGDSIVDEIEEKNLGDFSLTHTYTNPGQYTIHICVSDGYDESCQEKTVSVHYDCSVAVPNKSMVWPPNHKMEKIEIVGVTDHYNKLVPITIISITQDESVDDTGDGSIFPDGDGIGSETAWIRAERSGNGRIYRVFFTADDRLGLECEGFVSICIPHDKGKKHTCIEDKPIYNSITGDIVSTNGNDITVYQNDEREQMSYSALSFDSSVSNTTVSLSIEDPDSIYNDVKSIIVFWGDRHRSEYNGPPPKKFEHTYTRTGADYHIRVKMVNTGDEVFNYTFIKNESLTVSIP